MFKKETPEKNSSAALLTAELGELGQVMLKQQNAVFPVMFASAGLCLMVHSVILASFSIASVMVLLGLDILFFATYPKLFGFKLYGRPTGFFLLRPSGEMELVAGELPSYKTLEKTSKMMLSGALHVLLLFAPSLLGFYLFTTEYATTYPSLIVSFFVFSMNLFIYPALVYFFKATQFDRKLASQGLLLTQQGIDALAACYLNKHPNHDPKKFKLTDLSKFAATSKEYADILRRYKNLEDAAKIMVAVSGSIQGAKAVNKLKD